MTARQRVHVDPDAQRLRRAGDVEGLLRLTTHRSSLFTRFGEEERPLNLATNSIPVDWQLPFDGVDQKSHDVKGQVLESSRARYKGGSFWVYNHTGLNLLPKSLHAEVIE